MGESFSISYPKDTCGLMETTVFFALMYRLVPGA